MIKRHKVRVKDSPTWFLFRFQFEETALNDVAAATAILDRFLHHAQIIQIKGRSYRLRHGGRSTEADDDSDNSERTHGKKK